MHQCLCIDEILQDVAIYLQDSGECADLAHMALSCRAFYEPAITELWSSLEGLKPLIQCLPTDAIVISTDHYYYPNAIVSGSGLFRMPTEFSDALISKNIIRVPSDEEWSRFQYFARLVKTLRVYSCEDSEPRFSTHPDALDLLWEHHPGTILPNLARLEFVHWGMPDIVPMFIQPKLISVYFTPTLPVPASTFLECIETHAPKLQSLELEDDDEFLEEVRDPLSKTICALKDLKRLRSGYVVLNSAALIHLSSLPDLHALAFKLTQENVHAWASSCWGKFSRLAVLDVSTTLADAAIPSSMFESVDGKNLLGLTLRHYPDARVTSFDRLFSAISTLGRLVKVYLDFSTLAHAWEDGRVDDGVLRPLFHLPLMVDFTLRALPVAFSSTTLRELAKSWPCLRRLSFRPGTWSRQGPTIDVLDLAIIARECRVIEDFDAEVRPLGDDWSWDPAMPDLGACLLQTLNLTPTHVPRAASMDLVAFLSLIFPVAKMTCVLYAGTFIPQAELAEVDEAEKVMKEVCMAKNASIDPVLTEQLLKVRAFMDGILDLHML